MVVDEEHLGDPLDSEHDGELVSLHVLGLLAQAEVLAVDAGVGVGWSYGRVIPSWAARAFSAAATAIAATCLPPSSTYGRMRCAIGRRISSHPFLSVLRSNPNISEACS